MIEFAGWYLPERYSSIIDEHIAVRTRAGLFDVTHMGKVTVRGEQAEDYLQKMIVGDISELKDGQAIYSLMCYPNGGVLDDIIVYRFAQDDFFLVLNAANADMDFQWLIQNPWEGVTISNVSDKYALMSLQGPLSEEILQKLTETNLDNLKFFHMQRNVLINGCSCLLSRTGYTGEDGFEIYAYPEEAPSLWQAIIAAGEQYGILPAGLGARDTLRLEACLPLYGHELAPDISPLEAGLAKFVKFEKPDFIGRNALIADLAVGVNRKLVGVIMTDRGIPRAGYPVEFNGREIGWVTSGGYSPTLQKNIGLVLIESEHAEPGEKIEVVIRGKRIDAIVVQIPFYKKHYKK